LARKLTSISWSLLALTLYLATAIVLYGRSLIGHLSEVHAGQSSDPDLYIWFMTWWPYALSRHLNPFFTDLLWAPIGFNVAWSTSMPALSLLATPITHAQGPEVSFNLLSLILPALSAWSGFILIRGIVKQPGPALLGGYLFGFSPFMAAVQYAGHIFLTAIFLIPAAILLFWAQVEKRISALSFVLLFAITLVAQFLISMEIFATALTFGVIALVLALICWPKERERLVAAAIDAGVAIVCAVVILSPYLFYMLRASGIGMNPFWAGTASSDLVEFIVPTRVMMIGQLAPMRAVAIHYVYDSYPWDSGAYTSLPLLVIVAIFLKSRWSQPLGRFLALLTMIVIVAMLGRHLRIDGHSVAKLPWLVIGALPFINSAVTARFAIYYHLLLAVAVALWMAEAKVSRALKIVVAASIVFLQLPNLNSGFWSHPVEVPAFFESGEYRTKLNEGESVLVLPYGKGESMLWQVHSGMYFAMPEGWTGPVPPAFQTLPIVRAFQRNAEIPDLGAQLKGFLTSHQIKTILIDPAFPRAQFWVAQLQALGGTVETSGGVILVRMPYSDSAASG